MLTRGVAPRRLWTWNKQKFAQISQSICVACYIRCDLDLWPIDLEPRIGCHVLKLCAKFERNRSMHARVIALISVITPFRVIQDHRLWYQSKALMQLPISDQYTLTSYSYLAPFRSYCTLLVKFALSTVGYLSVTHSFGVNPLTWGPQNLALKKLEESLYHAVLTYWQRIIKATPTIVGEAFIFYLWTFFLQRTDVAAVSYTHLTLPTKRIV